MKVRNVGGRARTIRLEADELVNAVGGGASFRHARPGSAARWLHLEANAVRLAPHASRVVRFTADVPADAQGGAHYAGIVAVDLADLAPSTPGTAAAGRRTITIRRVSRLAQPVTIRLPGTLTRALALGRAGIDNRTTAPALDLELRPGGNVLIERADVRLRVLRDGHTVFTHAQRLGQLFPGSPVALRIPWRGRVQSGPYRVVGTVRPAGAPVVRIDTAVALPPATPAPTTAPGAVEQPAPESAVELPLWLRAALGGTALALLLLAVAVAALWRRSRKHAAAAAAGPSVAVALPLEPEPEGAALESELAAPPSEPAAPAPEQPVRPAELILAAPAEEVEVLDVARALGKVCAVRAHRALKDVQTRSAQARRRRELELGPRRR